MATDGRRTTIDKICSIYRDPKVYYIPNDILELLIGLSNNLGKPANDYVILGEGNTSAKVNDDVFYVEASGTELRTISSSGFIEVGFEPVIRMLDTPALSDAEVKQALVEAKVDPSIPVHPSVETVLHALCLQLDGVNFVGHTHPSAINMITCSATFETALGGRLFPDEIVVCGPAPVLVPYTDPGVPLAKEVKRQIDRHLDTYGETPKTIYMQNHGFIALGKSAKQIENITAMAAKTARILVGSYVLGGPRFMPPQAVDRIHTRPDEHYRQRVIDIIGNKKIR